MIQRPYYLEKLIQSRDNGFPKIITGIRRCGKSFLLEKIYVEYLISTGVKKEDIIILEMDSAKNYRYCDPLYLLDHVLKLTQSKEHCYVIIDEIQNVLPIINPIFTDGKHIPAKSGDQSAITFVHTVLELSRQSNIDLYITGSNSKMLSSDVQTEFRDKGTMINVRPLSFEEYYGYVKEDSSKSISDYLIYGGMPLAVTKRQNEKRTYLKELFETTYLKDIIERYHFKKTEALEELSILLATCVGQFLNTTTLSELFKKKTKNKIDDETVNDYINAFKDSFLLQEAPRYDIKGKKTIGSLKKYYYIDNGLRNARCDFIFEDEGQLLENVIYNELIYNSFNVSVGIYDKFEKNELGKTIRKTMEIDFFAEKGSKKYYIQACNDISDIKTKEREIKPYIALNDNILKILVVNKPIDEFRDNNGIIIIGLKDFLLRFIKH